MTLLFTVPGPPHGKGRPRASTRGGHVRMYTDKRTAAYEQRVAWAAAEALGDQPPITGPVSVSVIAYRQRPKKPGPKHECRGGVRWDGTGYRLCTSKPDIDNLMKSILDGINFAGVWGDDVQVAECHAMKLWCRADEQPRTEVKVIPL